LGGGGKGGGGEWGGGGSVKIGKCFYKKIYEKFKGLKILNIYGSWHGWVDQNLVKKTWLRVHFASFAIFIVLTSDDDKMISIHS